MEERVEPGELRWIRVRGYHCERCEHDWAPKSKDAKDKPLTCPKCKSPYWHRPRKAGASKVKRAALKR